VVKGFGPVAVVTVKERRKKIRYLVSTNVLLPALEIVKFYALRWKIEQMIKDLNQRLGLGDYQVRHLQAIQRHLTFPYRKTETSRKVETREASSESGVHFPFSQTTEFHFS
jgi:hypothetical protein